MTEHPAKPYVCPWWIGYFLINPLRRLLQDPVSIISPYVREGMTVLEVGPGMGYFSLPLASQAGERGKVICVDVQEKMLATLRKRAAKAGLAGRITTVVASVDSLHLDGYEGVADFALLFAVVHEVPDQSGLFAQIYRTMKVGGVLLLSEPKGHVSAGDFEKTVKRAEEKGFVLEGSPAIRQSISRILRKK